MAALYGKIAIGVDYRPCTVHIPAVTKTRYPDRKSTAKNERPYQEVIVPEKKIKALFHCWDPVTGNAIVEYEDGTIHEVEPTQIRFVDNAMSEYAFPEAKESREKSEDEWKPLKRVGYVCPKCGQGTMKLDEGIVLASNPPQYRYQCDKCGYVKCSSSWIEASVLDNYG